MLHKFNDVYSENNLSKINNGAYVINLDEFKSIGIYWIILCVNGNNIIYFDNFELNIFQKKLKNSLETRTNNNRI